MRTSFRRVIVASLATATLAGSLALAGTGAQAFSSRDCKLYGHCDYQGFVNSYNGDATAPPQTARQRQPAPAFQMHDESGITGPHGVGWY